MQRSGLPRQSFAHTLRSHKYVVFMNSKVSCPKVLNAHVAKQGEACELAAIPQAWHGRHPLRACGRLHMHHDMLILTVRMRVDVWYVLCVVSKAMPRLKMHSQTFVPACQVLLSHFQALLMTSSHQSTA